MANYCSFEIHIKGKRGNALLLVSSIPKTDSGSYITATGTDDAYYVVFRGNCKWSVNFNVTDDWSGNDIDIDLNTVSEEEIQIIGQQYWDYSLRAKSRVLECDVQVRYWSDESCFDYYDHFVNGQRTKKRRIEYDPDTVFDWNAEEYIGHEGESEDEELREAMVLMHANRFVRNFNMEKQLRMLMDQPGDITEDDDDEVDDDALDEQDEETNDSTVVPLAGDHYDLNSAVRFIISDKCVLQKTIDDEGEETLQIKSGQYKDDSPFTATLRDHTLEPEDGTAEQWIKKTIADSENLQYIYVPGKYPIFISTQTLPVLELGSIKMCPFILQANVFYNSTQYVSISEVLMMESALFFRHLAAFILGVLEDMRIHGDTLDLDDLDIPEIEKRLYPVFEGIQNTVWTFWKDNVYRTSEWEITLPDGFVQWNHTPEDGDIIFVPQDYADEPEEEEIPAIISMPHECMESAFEGETVSNYIDAHSKHGLLRMLALQYVEGYKEVFPMPIVMVSTVTHELLGGFALTGYSHTQAVSACMFTTKDISYQFHVFINQNDVVEDTELRASIARLMGGFRFTHSQWLSMPIMLEQPECLNGLLNGDTEAFDQAIEQLQRQFGLGVAGSSAYLDYCYESGIFNADTIRKNAIDLLAPNYATLRLATTKVDELLQKLQEHNAAESIMQHVYEKLKMLQHRISYKIKEPADEQKIGDVVVTRVVLHDKQEVNIPIPLSLYVRQFAWAKAQEKFEAKEKQGFGSMSALDFYRIKERIEGKRTQLSALFEANYDVNPLITFPGKKFVFTGIGVLNPSKKDHPIVQQVIARGGLFRQSVSGLTDYLVVGNDDPGETKIKEAIAQKEAGKPLQIIRLQDLEDALAGRLSTYTADHPEDTEDSEYLEAQNRTWEQIENERQERERLEEERRISKQLAADARAKKNAIEQLVCCLHAICEKKAAEAEAAESDAQDAAKPSIPVTMLPAGSEPQFTIKDGVLLNTLLPEDCTEIIFPEGIVEIEFGAMLPEGVLDGGWFDLSVQLRFTLFPQITRVVLPESLKKLRYNSLGNTFGEVMEIQLPANLEHIETFSFLHWHMRELVIPAATKFIGKDAFTGCTSLKSVTILNPDIEIQPGAFPDEWSEGGCLQQPILRIPHKLKDLAAQHPAVIVEYLDDEIPEEQPVQTAAIVEKKEMPVQKPAEPATKPAPTVAKTPYRMAVLEEEVIPAKPKKEGCYIATAVYGSYDAPEVLVLRRFRDETLQQTKLGRWFIRVYYKLSPSVAAKLRNAKKINGIVRKCLDRWVHHLESKA